MLLGCSVRWRLRVGSRGESCIEPTCNERRTVSYEQGYQRFFFQAEDGIRDTGVTGVQTCALPICKRAVAASEKALASSRDPVILYGAGHIAAEAGQTRKAISLASELASKPSSDFRADADLLLGEGDLKKSDAANALNKVQEAKRLADAWLAPFDPGRASFGIIDFFESS